MPSYDGYFAKNLDEDGESLTTSIASNNVPSLKGEPVMTAKRANSYKNKNAGTTLLSLKQTFEKLKNNK